MNILITGMILFLGIHLLPTLNPLRQLVLNKFSEKAYKGLFTLISVLGLILIIYGFSSAEFIHVYTPPVWGRHLAFTLVPIALILFAAANMPGHIRKTLKHPMLIGTLLWSVAHLSANGDRRTLILFGGFALWALIDLISVSIRRKTLGGGKPIHIKYDLMAVGGGILVAGVIFYFHGLLFGMPLR